MFTYISIALLALLIAYLYGHYRALQRNITLAKQSGIPYVVSPIHTFNRFWLVTHKLWLPLLYRLPKAWTESWIEYVTFPDQLSAAC